MSRVLAWATVVAAATACSGSSSSVAFEATPCEATAARIAVRTSGVVELNGREASVEQVADDLRNHQPAYSAACYHREAAEADTPHPNADKVVQAIIEARLPVTMYLDRAFERRVVLPR